MPKSVKVPKKGSKFEDKNSKKQQSSLYRNSNSKNSIIRINQAPLMLDKYICLTDDIYGGKVPEDVQGYLFCYKVVGYDSEKKQFKATYQLRMIKEDGYEWKHLDGEREELDALTYDHVKDGLELYNRAIGRVNAHDYEKTHAAEESLKRKANPTDDAITEEEVDMTDLEQAAHDERDNGGWMSQGVLDVSNLCSVLKRNLYSQIVYVTFYSRYYLN